MAGNVEPEHGPLEEEIPKLETLVFRFHVSLPTSSQLMTKVGAISDIVISARGAHLIHRLA